MNMFGILISEVHVVKDNLDTLVTSKNINIKIHVVVVFKYLIKFRNIGKIYILENIAVVLKLFVYMGNILIKAKNETLFKKIQSLP